MTCVYTVALLRGGAEGGGVICSDQGLNQDYHLPQVLVGAIGRSSLLLLLPGI